MTSSALDARIDVFQGLAAWPQVSGVPSSPTADSTASITVSGENVDYYIYRLGAGDWSSEAPVTEILELSGLDGELDLFILARSTHADYPAEDNALKLSWLVSDTAAGVTINADWPFPSTETNLTLWVSGTQLYRYSIDGGSYQPETAIADPIELIGLSDGVHTVSVIGYVNDSWQDLENVSLFTFVIDGHYSLDCSSLSSVRHMELGQVNTAETNWSWDGKDDAGALLAPGWYSILLTVSDELGRSSAAIKLAYLGDKMAGSFSLAKGAPQQNPHSHGNWLVWQDLRNGNWDIYAKNLVDGSAEIRVTTNSLHQENPKTDGRYVVWQDRQADGSWDIYTRELASATEAIIVTDTIGLNEQNPVVDYPWIVYQVAPIADPDAPWQLMAYNLQTGEVSPIAPSSQNQLDADIDQGHVVWQDFRDAGYGEIYLKDLDKDELRRITFDSAAQYHPVISGHWLVWSDKRNEQNDLYGYNLLSRNEIQLTTTSEDETSPSINGNWVVYQENSSGLLYTNLRLLYLDNLSSLQLTNSRSEKNMPSLASGFLSWQDQGESQSIMLGTLPDLQPVFNNQNIVAVTQTMAEQQENVFALLRLWHDQANVASISRFTSLVGTPVSETAVWEGDDPSGENFNLEAGSFLWVKFDHSQIIDLGQSGCNPIDLAAGVNAFSYWCFPDHLTSYSLIRSLGIEKVNGVRMLDAATGKWRIASVRNGIIMGEDFDISRISVLMLDLQEAINGWLPEL